MRVAAIGLHAYRNGRKAFVDRNKKPGDVSPGLIERLAATYSRRIYKTTTIGPAAFDGRVRNGNGSDRCGIATKVLVFRLKLPFKTDRIDSITQTLNFKEHRN